MKVNLGSGPVKGKNGWINIDLLEGADIRADLCEGIPLENDEVSFIYSSHFLEHLFYKDVCKVLLESYRIMAPGGMISICVPDARKYINTYYNNDFILRKLEDTSILAPSFYGDGDDVYEAALVSTGSPIDWLNYIAYSNGEHRYMFDQNNLISHLYKAGFSLAKIRPYDTMLDQKAKNNESIYAHAVKSI